MDAKKLVQIGLRLMAVYMIAVGIADIPIYLGAIYDAVRPNSSLSANWQFYLTGIFSPYVVGVVLWFLAPYIGKWVVGKTEGKAAPKSAVASDLQTAAFTVVGVYFVIQNLPILIFLIADGLGLAPGSNIPLTDGQSIWSSDHFYTALLRTLFGAALVLGSGFFTQLFRRFREFGMKADS